MRRVLLVSVVVGGLMGMGLGCGPDERVMVEQGRLETMKAFQAVDYKRTGGIAGSEDRISVSREGKIEVSGRLLGNASGQLSEFQRMQLARAFEGWEKLKDQYRAPEGSADAYLVEITYGGKTVIVSDAARDVPETFRRARERLEALTRDLPAGGK